MGKQFYLMWSSQCVLMSKLHPDIHNKTECLLNILGGHREENKS